jgi:protein-tyrosine phosphatase
VVATGSGDEMTALKEAGADFVVSLLAESEVGVSELTGESGAAEAAGIRFVSLSTPDRGFPQLGPYRQLVDQLAEEVDRGGHVVVHCRMGIGRSSMVAAGVLMMRGSGAQVAWASIREARGLEVPDTPEQKAWVEAALCLG